MERENNTSYDDKMEMLSDSFLGLYTIIYSVSTTVKKQTMLSILYNITVKRQKCLIITIPNLADKKVVAPFPPENNNLHYFYAQRKTHGFFNASQFSLST